MYYVVYARLSAETAWFRLIGNFSSENLAGYWIACMAEKGYEYQVLPEVTLA